MIKAIIFDFDGVIVDSEIKKFKELQSILKNTNFILKENDFKDMTGKKTSSFLSTKFPKMTKLEIKKVTELRRKKELFVINKNLIPGIKKLLEFIKSKKIKIAITTGSNRELIKKTIEKNKIKKFFDLIISCEDFKQSKPSPECYKKTLKKLNLKTSEVIIIEDSIAWIKASKSAKCKVFGITTYLNKTELSEADKVFRNHEEILEYVKNLF